MNLSPWSRPMQFLNSKWWRHLWACGAVVAAMGCGTDNPYDTSCEGGPAAGCGCGTAPTLGCPCNPKVDTQCCVSSGQGLFCHDKAGTTPATWQTFWDGPCGGPWGYKDAKPARSCY
jgi:hypothetical protein